MNTNTNTNMSMSTMNSVTLHVKINQKEFQLNGDATLQDAIVLFGATPPFAAAVNTEFVPKSSYLQKRLNSGDEIELISPITGG